MRSKASSRQGSMISRRGKLALKAEEGDRPESLVRKGVFGACLACCAAPVVGPPIALVAGIIFGLVLGNPWPLKTSAVSKKLLQISVVGLGFGLSLGRVIETGKASLIFTAVGITLTLAAGMLIGEGTKDRAQYIPPHLFRNGNLRGERHRSHGAGDTGQES